MMEVTGYIASALIGVSLGLIGGGGSILTVPVLVYLFQIDPILATSYSLFIVGSTSLVGAVNNVRSGLVSWKTTMLFGSASVFTVFAVRKFLVPLIPQNIVTPGGITLTSSFLTLVLFGILMLMASASMIRDQDPGDAAEERPLDLHFVRLIAYGVGIGLITGLLGAGGGFLLIPTLVFLLKLPMKKAVGTSLAIIAINSLMGFVGDLGHFSIHWSFLLAVSAIASGGIFIGERLSRKIPAEKLKKGFGWFVLIMALYILGREISKSFLV